MYTVILQCTDGSHVVQWRHIQDSLLHHEAGPTPVLGLWLTAGHRGHSHSPPSTAL